MAKVYISGPISANVEQAAIQFTIAEQRLKLEGHEVINPMKLPHNHDKSWESYMREDIKAMMECDMVYFLKDWLESKGARLEYLLASELNIECVFEEP